MRYLSNHSFSFRASHTSEFDDEADALSLDFRSWVQSISSAAPSLSIFSAKRTPVTYRHIRPQVPSLLEQLELAFLTDTWTPTRRISGTVHLPAPLDFS